MAKASAPTNPQIILKGTLEVDSSMKLKKNMND